LDLGVGRPPRLASAQNGVSSTRPTISYRTTIYRPRSEMKWLNFLTVPRKHRRARSGARSEVGSLDSGPSDADLVAPRPTNSTPNLRISASTMPTPSPSTSRSQESNGTQTNIFRMIHLTTLFSCNTDPHSVSDQILSVPGTGRGRQSDGNHPNSPGYTINLRATSEGESNSSSTTYATTTLKGTSNVDRVAPHPTESTPALRISASTMLTPSPLTSHDQESNGTQSIISWMIHPSNNTFLCNTDPNLVSNQDLSVPGRDQSDGDHPEPPGHTVDPRATSKGKSSWVSTAYATTKLAINLVKESSDVFPPLKSVAGGLSAILSHCDVRMFCSCCPTHYAYSCPSKLLPAGRQLNHCYLVLKHWQNHSVHQSLMVRLMNKGGGWFSNSNPLSLMSRVGLTWMNS